MQKTRGGDDAPACDSGDVPSPENAPLDKVSEEDWSLFSSQYFLMTHRVWLIQKPEKTNVKNNTSKTSDYHLKRKEKLFYIRYIADCYIPGPSLSFHRLYSWLQVVYFPLGYMGVS